MRTIGPGHAAAPARAAKIKCKDFHACADIEAFAGIRKGLFLKDEG
jgi:hypothetical protein